MEALLQMLVNLGPTRGEALDYKAVDDLWALPLPKAQGALANDGYDGDRLGVS